MTTQPKTTEAENPYLTREDALAILNTPDDQLDELIARAEKLRRKYKGDNVGIHILTNARSGNCSQDCAYCAQSCRSSADIEKYKWVSDEKLYRDNDFVNKNHLARHCIGLSGMKFTDAEIEELAAKIRKMKETGPGPRPRSGRRSPAQTSKPSPRTAGTIPAVPSSSEATTTSSASSTATSASCSPTSTATCAPSSSTPTAACRPPATR